MYMPGRLRTASRPLRTVILSARYVASFFLLLSAMCDFAGQCCQENGRQTVKTPKKSSTEIYPKGQQKSTQESFRNSLSIHHLRSAARPPPATASEAAI